MNRSPSLVFLPLLVCAAAPSQSTHLVGPNGLAEIRDAIATASSGDTILVEPGSYAQFTADKGLTIRAITAGTVQVVADPSFANCGTLLCPPAVEAATRIAAPAGETVVIDGIDFPGTTVNGPLNTPWSTRLVVQSGRAVLVDTAIHSRVSGAALEVVDASAHLIRCQLSVQIGTPIAGLVATNATVTMTDSFVSGSSFQSAVPGPGAVLTHSVLHASSSAIGAGGQVSGRSIPAISAGPASTLWISDSTLVGDPATCPISAGLNVRLVRCDFDGGAGCPAFENGALVGVRQDDVPIAGQPFALVYTAAPQTFVGVVASFGLADRSLPVLEQPWFSEPNPITAALLFTNGQGEATGSWVIPAVLQGAPLYFHAVSGPRFPLQTAPVAGGVVR